MRPPLRPRVVARIARWEALKGTGSVDRRTAAVGLVGLLVLVAVLPSVVGGGLSLDRGIYRVGVTPDSPYARVVADDPTFAVRGTGQEAVVDGRLAPDEGYDLVLTGDRVVLASDGGEPTAKSRAALSTLRRSVSAYNDRRMRAETNETAAFPVFPVTLQYAERDRVEEAIAPPGGGGSGDGSGEPGTTDGDRERDRTTTTDDGGSGGEFGVPSVGGDLFGTGTSVGSPSDVAPPFPFQSLVLAFAFVVPLNFVVQAYSSSVLGERINRRGELLLVAPVTPREVVAGKTLPYFLAATGATAAIAVAVGGGPLSVFAMAPLALLFLGAAFVGAMFARSFKELTFVTVTVSVALTTFAFVPAIFTDVNAVALVSPLTLVVRDLAGTAVDPVEVGFATLPTGLAAFVLFGLGVGVYREEDMFTQRPVHLKALDAVAGRIRRPRSLVLVTGLSVPFVFVAELLAVALLYAVPGGLSIPLVLVAVAVVEELAKSVPVLAGFANARYPRTVRTALAAGAASGVGFFLAEKLTLVVQLVGLPELRVGNAAFQVGAGGGGPLLLGALLVAPLALHVVTASVSALGASRGVDAWLVATAAAVLLHVGYNLAVVSALV